MPKLSNIVETVVIALEDESALTNLQTCMEIASPPAPKYYIVHAIPMEHASDSGTVSSERRKAETLLQKCKSWLKSKYPCARIELCLVEGRFDEEVIALVNRSDADVLIVSHSAAKLAENKSTNYAACLPCSVLELKKGRG